MSEVNKLTPDGISVIPTSSLDDFFRYWFEFLRPFHNLANREMQVIASLTKHRYLLSKVIKDDIILDKVLMGEETRKEIREECGLTPPHFQIIIGKLRKQNILIDNRINPKFIPNIKEESGQFKMLLLFKFPNGQETS